MTQKSWPKSAFLIPIVIGYKPSLFFQEKTLGYGVCPFINDVSISLKIFINAFRPNQGPV